MSYDNDVKTSSGNTEAEAVEMSRFIQEDLGFAVGNNARNHIPLDVADHRNIHKYAVDIGAQIAPKTHETGNYNDTAIGQMMAAAGSSNLDHKKIAVSNFLRSVQPRMEAYIDDLVTAREFGNQIIDRGEVFEAIMNLPEGNPRVAQMVMGLDNIGAITRRVKS